MAYNDASTTSITYINPINSTTNSSSISSVIETNLTNPYSISSNASTMFGYPPSEITTDIQVDRVLKIMPLLLKIKKIKKVNDKQLEISFTKHSHKNSSKFFPDNGTILINEANVYGVYNTEDYYYWDDCLIVEVEDIDKAISLIKPGMIFTTINNFDELITNEETKSFLNDPNNYSKYAHKRLEQILTDSFKTADKSYKIEYHKKLDKKLLN